MPRYYFHLIDSTDCLLDPDGLEIRTEDVAKKTLECARDCLAGDVKDGRLDLRYRIDVQDENERLIHSLPFGKAIELIGLEQCALTPESI